MKKLLKIVTGLMLVSSFALANSPNEKLGNVEARTFKMAMYFDQASGIIKTFYEKDLGEYLKIEILNTKGKVLTESFMSKKRNSARYNFDISNLDSGVYTLRVSLGDEVIIRKISLSEVNAKKVNNYKMELI
ncbi:T9SS type A sorting domain-containing protein [uncultured Arcticibacterium sp.]|uniref:T9SS type A sorting domain-containing protein n=1 Tax=uncultured Arcticibacterium sp. TaxID=2173042 RepID=UPI0030FC5CD8